MNAITEFLKKRIKIFKIDKKINFKQLLTNNPNGYLKKIR